MEETKLLLDRGGKIYEGGKVCPPSCQLISHPMMCTSKQHTLCASNDRLYRLCETHDTHSANLD